jgi:glycosyltransferase involved in cell wall biosynthesis
MTMSNMTSTEDSSHSGAPHILYISPAFVPRCDSEAFCSAKFVTALSESGAALKVLTCPGYGSQAVDGSSSWQNVRKHVVNFPVPSHKDRVQSLRMAVRFQTRSFARWIGAAVEEAKRLHRQRPFDVVYSRSLPMFGHIAGYWCAEKLDIPWIANVNDPWDWHLFPVGRVDKAQIPGAISSFWMRRTFRSADLVTYPNDRLHAYHLGVSGIPHDALIIPHVGGVSSWYQTPETDWPAKTFSLVHAGKLGTSDSTGRSAKPLLHGLRLFLQDFPEACEKTKLTFVGPPDKTTESLVSALQLESIVHSVGRVTYEESLLYVQAATACVLVEAEMSEGIFLPSKLVDYLSARKPVLALSPGVGVVNDMAKSGGILRVEVGDVEAVRRAIGSLYLDFRSGTVSRRAPSQEQVNQFNPEFLARKFLAAFYNLDRSKKPRGRNRTNRGFRTDAAVSANAK